MIKTTFNINVVVKLYSKFSGIPGVQHVMDISGDKTSNTLTNDDKQTIQEKQEPATPNKGKTSLHIVNIIKNKII